MGRHHKKLSQQICNLYVSLTIGITRCKLERYALRGDLRNRGIQHGYLRIVPFVLELQPQETARYRNQYQRP
jgi:hypothetical protein